MGPEEESPLDLNNLPEDYTRDGKQLLDDTSSSGIAGNRPRKKNGKDERVYECRFCSLKFCKSQALGGHMNRHRQERETETLNKARQLVYNSDTLAAPPPPPPPPFSAGHFMTQGGGLGYPPHHQHHQPLYPTRLFSGSPTSSPLLPPPPPPAPPHHQPYLYTSPSQPAPSCHHQYTSIQPLHPISDCHMAYGHALTSSASSSLSSLTSNASTSTNYTCIGAPVRVHGFGSGPGLGRPDGLMDHERLGLSWGRSSSSSSNMDSSMINRYHDHGL